MSSNLSLVIFASAFRQFFSVFFLLLYSVSPSKVTIAPYHRRGSSLDQNSKGIGEGRGGEGFRTGFQRHGWIQIWNSRRGRQGEFHLKMNENEKERIKLFNFRTQRSICEKQEL